MIFLNHHHWMQHALSLAKRAESENEVPIGAVLIQNDQIIGEGWNQPISQSDPTAHAEIMALRDAGKKINNYRLPHTTLYVTIEPCMMCVGALLHARVQTLIYGAHDPKAGAVWSVKQLLDEPAWNHKIAYQHGVCVDECRALIQAFFQKRR